MSICSPLRFTTLSKSHWLFFIFGRLVWGCWDLTSTRVVIEVSILDFLRIGVVSISLLFAFSLFLYGLSLPKPFTISCSPPPSEPAPRLNASTSNLRYIPPSSITTRIKTGRQVLRLHRLCICKGSFGMDFLCILFFFCTFAVGKFGVVLPIFRVNPEYNSEKSQL